jgi:gamma-glutamylcyclotransferase (GGCT)/AIG2-like uncharacterized protein YtfP
MSQYLFAYGTLQPGCAPAQIAHLAAKLRAVGEGFVSGVLYDLGGYPGAVPDANAKSKIAGTVMLLPEEESLLRQLDAYEGFDPRSPESSEYVRELRSVELVAGGSLECWIYIYNWKADASRAIKSGAWRKNRERGTEGTREQED